MDKDYNNTGVVQEEITLPENTVDESVSSSTAGKKRKLNIVPKIVCLLLAVLIWYYVMQVENPDYQQTFTGVKVTLVNTDELTNRGLSIFNGTNYIADLTVSGKKSVISSYTSDDITIRADVLKNYTSPGMQTVDLEVSLPAGLTLVDQDNSISVFVDEKTSRKFTLEIDQLTKNSATITDDYEAGAIIADPAEITVKGPKTVMDDIDRAVVKADFSQFGKLENTISTEGTVCLYDKDGNEVSNVYIENPYPTVKLTQPILLEKDVVLNVTFKNGFYNGTNVATAAVPSSVRIKGNASDIRNVSSIDLPPIDEKTIDKDKTTVTVPLETSELYTVVGDVTSAEVTVTNLGTTTSSYRVTNLTVVGDGGKFTVADDYVDVTLRGPAGTLSGISANDITLKCDLGNYSDPPEGEYSASVVIAGSPAGVWEIGSYELKLEIAGT